MAIPTFVKSKIRQDVLDQVRGNPDNSGTTVIDRLINRGVRDVGNQVKLRSRKRKMDLALSGANDTQYDESDGNYDLPTLQATGAAQENRYEFHCPTDLDGINIIDIAARNDRTGEYRFTTQEEFDHRKTVEMYLAAIKDNSWERKLLVTGVGSIDSSRITDLDVVTGFTAVGGASNLATDVEDFVQGDGAISFDTDMGSATAGITKSALSSVDLSGYIENSDIFVWVKIPDASLIDSFTLRWGSDSSNYVERTVQHTHDLLAFYAGWNLLRFPWDDESEETGEPDVTDIVYVSFFMNKDVAKTAAVGFVADNIIARINPQTDVYYYTKYGWQTSEGIYKEESDDDADFVNADSDEYSMIVDYVSALVSGKLGNKEDKTDFMNDFEKKASIYQVSNPSETIVMETTYQFVESQEAERSSEKLDSRS